MLLLFTQQNNVYACSGGSANLRQLAEYAEVIVHGHMVQTDEIGQNGVLQVESYLKGEAGLEFILLGLYPPPMYDEFNERPTSGGCFHGVPPLQYGDEIIIFLNRNADGSYALASRGIGNPAYYPFPEPDSVIAVQHVASIPLPEKTPDPNLDPRLNRVYTTDVDYVPLGLQTGETVMAEGVIYLTRPSFAALISTTVGKEAVSPLLDMPYPTVAPLLAHTSDGKTYLVPVDGADPYEVTLDDLRTIRRDKLRCTTVGCTAWSPNGIDHATIETHENSTKHYLNVTYNHTVDGSAIVFSVANDAAAVWVEQDNGSIQLQIYTLTYHRLRWQDSPFVLLTRFELQADAVSRWLGSGAWSPEGRFFAFSDDRGVWLWDVFTPDAQPQALLDEALNVTEFSPRGRFLSLRQDTNIDTDVEMPEFHLDLITKERLPAGAISPDDRVLIPLNGEPQLMYLTPNRVRQMWNITESIRDAQWLDEQAYVVSTCRNANYRRSCDITGDASVGFGYGKYNGYIFDVEPASGSLVVVNYKSQIVTFSALHRRQIETRFPASIERIEWLPSLFYSRRPS